MYTISRYLLKQAKWQVSGQPDEEVQEEKKKREVPHYVLNIGNKPETKDTKDDVAKNQEDTNDVNPLENALNDVNEEEEGLTDFSKRTHILIISEKSEFVF